MLSPWGGVPRVIWRRRGGGRWEGCGAVLGGVVAQVGVCGVTCGGGGLGRASSSWRWAVLSGPGLGRRMKQREG